MTIFKLEEIANSILYKLIDNLIIQAKFRIEKYLCERDLLNIFKYIDDNLNLFEIMLIITHNIQVVVNTFLTYGVYYKLPQKKTFMAKTETFIMDIILIIKRQFELIFIIKNNKQTITIFHEFLDVLINKVIENNLSNLYKMFKLTNLWHKVDKVVKVYNKFKKVKGLSTNIRI